ncbi:hypothetical protein GCM10009077_31760 [Roseibium denhamense]
MTPSKLCLSSVAMETGNQVGEPVKRTVSHVPDGSDAEAGPIAQKIANTIAAILPETNTTNRTSRGPIAHSLTRLKLKNLYFPGSICAAT